MAINGQLLLSLSTFTLLVLLSPPLLAVDTPITRFQQFLRFNTAHPNPNYAPPVSFLISQAQSIGIQHRTYHFTEDKTKPVLLLTWQGSDPSLGSILFNSHLDSVPAEPDKWAHLPFAAYRSDEDGKIFARGAQDDKCISMQYLEAIRVLKLQKGYTPIRTIHLCYVPDEEIGGLDGAARFYSSKEFAELNVEFAMDEGQASINDEFRVFYADRSPWNVVIKARGAPGHGSRMFDNSAMENLMKSVEVITKFREIQFDLVKAGLKGNGEVVSVNSVFVKAGIPSPTGFVMNMQPSEAEAGFNIRIPPTADPELLRQRISLEWAPAHRNMTYKIAELGPLRDNMGRPLLTAADDSNQWWSVFNQAISAVGGKLATPEILPSTTDARYIRKLGIPALGFSPMTNTPILLHDHNEHLRDTVYLRGIGVYESIFSHFGSFDVQVSAHISAT
ncbi:hypothetical protein ACFE04_025732 [Oxalis oulophora]